MLKRSPQFKALEAEWYKRLKDEGFKDIEDSRSEERFLKSWHSSYFQSRFTDFDFRQKEEYFREAGKFLEWHKFSSSEDKEIWRLHTEGQTVRQISQHFQGEPGFSRAKIHKTIKRLFKVLSGELKEKTPEDPTEQFKFRFDKGAGKKR